MVAVLTTALTSAAEIFNVFSIIVVMGIFVFMSNFILRLRADDLFGTSVVYVGSPSKVQVEVQKVEIPFTVQLIDSQTSSYDGFKLRIQSKVPYFVYAYWGLSSRYLNNVLSLSWAEFYQKFIDQPHKEAFHTCDTRKLDESSDIELSTESPLNLGPPTREYFPLVIVLIRQSSSYEDITDVAATISVIHIKDNDLDLSTCLLYQYLKQYTGQFCHLTPLYAEGCNESSYDATGEDDPLHDTTCIVCQMNEVSRVLLPCRHFCICGQCCNKLETCPMCRSRIMQYFITGPEDYPIPTVNQVTEPPESQPWWLERMFQPIIDAIGLD